MGLFDGILSRDSIKDSHLFTSANVYRIDRTLERKAKPADTFQIDAAAVDAALAKKASKKRKLKETGADLQAEAAPQAQSTQGGDVSPDKKDKKQKREAATDAEPAVQISEELDLPVPAREKGRKSKKEKSTKDLKNKKSKKEKSAKDIKKTKSDKEKSAEDLKKTKSKAAVQISDVSHPADPPSKKPRKSKTDRNAKGAEQAHAYEHETVTKARQTQMSAPALPDADADAESNEADLEAKVTRTPAEEAEVLERTIFVGNLPADMKRKQLSRVFSECGEIESIRFRSVPVKLEKMLPRRAAVLSNHISTNRGSAHAYIVFKTLESAQAALKHNMEELNGRHLRVDVASKPRQEGKSLGGGGANFDTARSIFVGNLPFDVEDEEVISLFNDKADGANSVAAVRVVRDQETNLGKGIAYVMFRDKNIARMAMAKDGALLRKRPIRVTRVAVESKRVQRNVSSLGRAQATGAVGRLQRKEQAKVGKAKTTAVASWQGTQTKGKGKVRNSAAAKAPREPRQEKSKTASAKAGEDQPTTRTLNQSASAGTSRKVKRPAVAIRKAKALGVNLPKGVTKKTKGNEADKKNKRR